MNRQDAKMLRTAKAPSRQELLRTSLLSTQPSFRRMPESGVMNNMDSGMRRNDNEITVLLNNVFGFSWRLGALAVRKKVPWRTWHLGGSTQFNQ